MIDVWESPLLFPSLPLHLLQALNINIFHEHQRHHQHVRGEGVSSDRPILLLRSLATTGFTINRSPPLSAVLSRCFVLLMSHHWNHNVPSWHLGWQVWKNNYFWPHSLLQKFVTVRSAGPLPTLQEFNSARATINLYSMGVSIQLSPTQFLSSLQFDPPTGYSQQLLTPIFQQGGQQYSGAFVSAEATNTRNDEANIAVRPFLLIAFLILPHYLVFWKWTNRIRCSRETVLW